ncbi:toluene-4-monooxygenase system B family protein [Zavarzinia compransoris]|nr:toluene-4-monooxygenase system B family protein [Zavarzinia compransoris]TDP49387.1 toluene-4-monooxygenase system protein B [Zavarzinia compransoris]
MSDLPLLVSCERDFLVHLVAIPAEARIADLIEAAASLVVGVHVPERPLSQIRLRKIDGDAALPLEVKVGDSGIEAMDWVHLFFEPAHDGKPLQ